MATKQRGLSDEINDVVLGPFSPRRGSDYLLQPPRPPPPPRGDGKDTCADGSEPGQSSSPRRTGRGCRGTVAQAAPAG